MIGFQGRAWDWVPSSFIIGSPKPVVCLFRTGARARRPCLASIECPARGLRDSQTRLRSGGRLLDVPTAIHLESSVQAARTAGLRYLTDSQPGLRRIARGEAFTYETAQGERITDPETLARIKSLAVPPAWQNVWIAPKSDAHLQATGRDVRGRKQYRYHPDFRVSRDTNKYGRMLDFARALPRIRRRVSQHLRLPGLPRNKVLAAVIRLLEQTHIRVGNDEYARTNGSFGLTTFRNRHAKVNGSRVRFEFKGKSGIRHAIDIRDPAIARLVRKCQDLPGQQLFTYSDDGETSVPVGSEDVNSYLREVSDDDFTAKDFRTWAGTVMAAVALRTFPPFASETEARRNIVQAIAAVAKMLGNTPAVCRKCYVHPSILEAYLRNQTIGAEVTPNGSGRRAQSPDERAVIALLRVSSRQRRRRSTPKI